MANLGEKIKYFQSLRSENSNLPTSNQRSTSKLKIPEIFVTKVDGNEKTENSEKRSNFPKAQSVENLNQLQSPLNLVKKSNSHQNLIEKVENVKDDIQDVKNDVVKMTLHKSPAFENLTFDISNDTLHKTKGFDNLSDVTDVKDDIIIDNSLSKPKIFNTIPKKIDLTLKDDTGVEIRKQNHPKKTNRTQSLSVEPTQPKLLQVVNSATGFEKSFIDKLNEIKSKRKSSEFENSPRTFVFNFVNNRQSQSMKNLDSIRFDEIFEKNESANENSEKIEQSNVNSEKIGHPNEISEKIGPYHENSEKIGQSNVNSEKIGQSNVNSEKNGHSNAISEKIGHNHENSDKIGQSNEISEQVGQFNETFGKIGNSQEPSEKNYFSNGPDEILEKNQNSDCNENLLKNVKFSFLNSEEEEISSEISENINSITNINKQEIPNEKSVESIEKLEESTREKIEKSIENSESIENWEEMIENSEESIENSEESIENSEESIENSKSMENSEKSMENSEELMENSEDLIENSEELIEKEHKKKIGGLKIIPKEIRQRSLEAENIPQPKPRKKSESIISENQKFDPEFDSEFDSVIEIVKNDIMAFDNVEYMTSDELSKKGQEKTPVPAPRKKISSPIILRNDDYQEQIYNFDED